MCAFDAEGKRLVWLTGHHGSPEEVIRCARRIQGHVLTRTCDYLRRNGWVLPEYLVAGRAIEQAILEGLRRPTTRFSVLFDEQLEVAVEYMKLRGLVVDRWILQERGASLRRQALIADLAEASFQLPMRSRQVMYLWLKDGVPVRTIAKTLSLAETEVRSILRTILSGVRPRVRARLSAWVPSSAAKARAKRRRH